MSEEEQNNPPNGLKRIAQNDFENARRRGFWRSVASWLSRSSNDLLPFDEVRKTLPLVPQHSIGLRQVPTQQIVGSVGRYLDFDRAFMPRQVRTRHRWESIDLAHLQDVNLPPVELYKIGPLYFVKDGNHRVSVARERGQAYIDADVIELDLDIDVTPEMNIDGVIRKIEQADFYHQTDLNEIFPDSKVELTVAGGYQKLLEHICAHQYFMGLERKNDVTLTEAVISWYEQVYMPLVHVIREQNILREFPGRTEADLYLWIIEHLWYLREELHEDVSLLEAASHFTGEYSLGLLPRLLSMIMGIAPAPPPEKGQDDFQSSVLDE